MSQKKALEYLAKEEITRYKEYYRNSLKSKTRILDIIASYVHHRNENKILPLVTMLSAKATGKITPDTYVAAAIIDLLYTATRIHEDVEEETFSGNIFTKINSLWKEKLSVLMGDYFLAQGLLLAVKKKNYELLEIFSQSVKQITEGELRILYNTNNLNLSQKDYLDIAHLKSGSLFSACAKAGAISAMAQQEEINKIASFGENYGMAIFIKNELNFQNNIINSKYRLTLPLLLSFENCTGDEKNSVLKYFQYPVDKNITRQIQRFIETKEGIHKATLLMENYKNKALEDITEFHYSKTIETLKLLVNSTI